MAQSSSVASGDAADVLGVSQQEVRRLVKAGLLRGDVVAHRVMVDRASLEHRARRQVRAGRRRTPANAWGLLRLLSGEEATFLDVVTRSKLRAALRTTSPEGLFETTYRRAVAHRYRLRAGYLEALRAQDGLVRTGLSGIDSSFDLVTFGGATFDAYCDEPTHDRLVRDYGLVPGDELSDVTLRVTDAVDLARGMRATEGGAPSAVTAAVCLDLMDSLDARALQAGRQRLVDLLGAFITGSGR